VCLLTADLCFQWLIWQSSATREVTSVSSVWNSLPQTVLISDSLSVFKSRLKTLFCLIKHLLNTDPTCRQRLWSYDHGAIRLLLNAQHKLGRLCFYPKAGFWPSYCQISTDLDKSLDTPIVIRNRIHLWADLDRDRRVGSSRPNQNDCFFVILVTHPKSHIETTDRRDFGGKPSKWRWERVLSWKISEFCSVGGSRSKTAFFRIFRVTFDYPAHSLQETVLPQINGTDEKPRLWRCAFC